MVIVIVVVTGVIFALVDYLLRVTLSHRERVRVRKKRAKALDLGLKLEFSDQAPSLKRVEVEKPKARILAVDDERVILDSFRKILVLAGYSIDTVETGKEALGLIRKNDYDFVFTDLKMPEMDGIDVTKAVNHVRPDIDVVMITGHATVETAVEAMKHGAVDHVEKPFTEEELVSFVDKIQIKRDARLSNQKPPEVKLQTADSKSAGSEKVINVPGGIFVSDEHVWVNLERSGNVRLGLDEFANRTLGVASDLELPIEGQVVERGEVLFGLISGKHKLFFNSPVSGTVVRINSDLPTNLDLTQVSAFDKGWICQIKPSQLTSDLVHLRVGADALDWYRQHVESVHAKIQTDGGDDKASPETWDLFKEVCMGGQKS